MQMKNLAVLVALPLALVACGGGGGSSSGGGIVAGSTIQSQFIDAPVKGLKYTIGTTTGFTGDNGIFSCKDGEEVTFSVKNKVIGSATCGAKIYISDMILPNDSSVGSTNIAASLIQSLSKLTGGILDLTTFNSSTLDLTLVDLTNSIQADSTIASALSGNTLGLNHVDVADAEDHVAAYLPDLANDPVMAELASSTSGGVWVTLNKTAGDAEQCWDKISAKISVSETLQTTGKKNYRFNVIKALGHDVEGNVTDFDTECDTQGEHATCYPSPVQPRYMTGRSMSFSSYEASVDDLKKDETKVCLLIDEDDFKFYPINSTCPGGAGSLLLDKDYVDNWYEALTMGFTVTDSGYTLTYHERGAGLQPNPATATETTIGLVNMSDSCSYSVTDTFK